MSDRLGICYIPRWNLGTHRNSDTPFGRLASFEVGALPRQSDHWNGPSGRSPAWRLAVTSHSLTQLACWRPTASRASGSWRTSSEAHSRRHAFAARSQAGKGPDRDASNGAGCQSVFAIEPQSRRGASERNAKPVTNAREAKQPGSVRQTRPMRDFSSQNDGWSRSKPTGDKSFAPWPTRFPRLAAPWRRPRSFSRRTSRWRLFRAAEERIHGAGQFAFPGDRGRS